VTQMR